ncbi:hypothetical protein ACYCOI_25605, partial [Klebsiella pneumoniae]
RKVNSIHWKKQTNKSISLNIKPSERTGMQFSFLITNASLNSLFNLADVRIKFSRQQRSWD